MGFDQMMLMYDQYTVVSSKISIVASNITATVTPRIGVYLSPDAVSITDPIRLMENGLISTRVHDLYGVPGHIREHSMNCDVNSYFGRTKGRGILNDVLLYGTAAANPSEAVYFAVTAWDAIGASVSTTAFDVVIEYDAYFWEPKKLTTS